MSAWGETVPRPPRTWSTVSHARAETPDPSTFLVGERRDGVTVPRLGACRLARTRPQRSELVGHKESGWPAAVRGWGKVQPTPQALSCRLSSAEGGAGWLGIADGVEHCGEDSVLPPGREKEKEATDPHAWREGDRPFGSGRMAGKGGRCGSLAGLTSDLVRPSPFPNVYSALGLVTHGYDPGTPHAGFQQRPTHADADKESSDLQWGGGAQSDLSHKQRGAHRGGTSCSCLLVAVAEG
jgi:hypothetical protein